MKIYVKKPNISGCKININYEGKFTLKLLMKINIEKPNVKKNVWSKSTDLDTKSSKNSMSKNGAKTALRLLFNEL